MKITLLLGLFFLSFLTLDAQERKKIDIRRLVRIIETADFTLMVNTVKNLRYRILDSSVIENSLNYITREIRFLGNTLGCFTDSKLKVQEISFSTYDKDVYDELKRQIIGSKFNSNGLHKGYLKETIETEDFEKGNILISTGVKDLGDGRFDYEFSFLKLK